MRKNTHHIVLHYVTLFTFLLLGLVEFWLLGGYPNMQFLLGLILCGLYVAWGVVLHVLDGDFHPRIMIEYILVAALAAVILYNVLFHSL